LTEDDAALINYQYAVQESDDSSFPGTARYTDPKSDTGSPVFNDFDTVMNLDPKESSSIPRYRDKPKPGARNIRKNDYAKDELPEVNISNRTTVILVTIFVCIALLGVVFYLIIRPSGNQQPSAERPSTETVAGEDENEPTDLVTEDEEPLEITSILVSLDGRTQNEFHAGVNETVTLQARIQPEWIETDIIWISSDPEILEITHLTENGSQAQITGIFPGVADIILSANDFEIYFVVYVDDLPIHTQLENAVNNSGMSVWLTILWTSGPDADYETLFKRDTDSDLWVTETQSGTNDISPTFIPVNNALTISLPTSDKVYYLFADNTGFYGNLGSPDNEDFRWWFFTIEDELAG